MVFKNLTLKVENKIAFLMINRPERANSMTEEAWSELKQALIYCDETPEVRAIVFSGAGEKLFCGGIDLTMLMSVGQKTDDKCDGRKREKFRKSKELIGIKSTKNSKERRRIGNFSHEKTK